MSAAAAEETVRRFVKAWATGDTERSFPYIAEDAVYALHISNEVLPFGGETVGRAAIEAALRMMREQFDYLLYRPHNFVAEDDAVRLRVEFMYRHKPSGEVLAGNFRSVYQIRDGLIARCDEYHDRAMVESFMRLFGGG